MERCPISLIGFNNLCYDPDGKLCSKTEPLPDVPVRDFLENNLVIQLPFKRYPGNKVAGTVEFDEGINQCSLLFIMGKQFYLKGLKHNIDIYTQYIRVSQFLPHLKRWASLRLEIVKEFMVPPTGFPSEREVTIVTPVG